MNDNAPYLSIIIPAYNEGDRIKPTLQAIHAWLQEAGYTYEIIVVNDGSSDHTSVVVSEAAQQILPLRLVESFPNRGKGHVVRVGMLEAQGALRLFIDADHSIPISELPKFLEAVEAGSQVAIASRRAAGAQADKPLPWYRRAWSRVANKVVQHGLLKGVRDTQCGFKLFTAPAAEACFSQTKFNGWAFDLEALALAQALGYRITEVPVAVRHDERTNISPIRDAVRVTREFLKIRKAFKRGDYRLP